MGPSFNSVMAPPFPLFSPYAFPSCFLGRLCTILSPRYFEVFSCLLIIANSFLFHLSGVGNSCLLHLCTAQTGASHDRTRARVCAEEVRHSYRRGGRETPSSRRGGEGISTQERTRSCLHSKIEDRIHILISDTIRTSIILVIMFCLLPAPLICSLYP